MALKVAITGAEKGRMGQALAALCEVDADLVEVASINAADIVVDFTAPDATLQFLAQCHQATTPIVIGTTGFSEEQEKAIRDASSKVPILKSGNMSLGVNLLAALVEQAAAKLGDDYDIEIFEAHHRHKVDAPSGTALLLGDAAAKGRDVSLGEKAVRGRDGITGVREVGTIGFSVLRSGGIIGDHDVSFGAEEELLTLSHRSLDRKLFARGALAATKWLVAQKPGLYSMRDMLDL